MPGVDPLAPPPPPEKVLAGQTSASVVSGLEGNRARARQLVGEEGALRDTETKLFSDVSDQREAAVQDKQANLAEVKSRVPLAQPPKDPPEFHEMAPVKEWGSAAMMFAMFGSLLTRTPMTTALNAAAATIKAFRQRDVDAYNLNFKKWQVESANATKMYEYQQQAYTKAVAEAEKEVSETDLMYSHRARDIEAHVRSLANSFKDEKMLLVLDNQGLAGVEKALQDERMWATQMERAQTQVVKAMPDQVAFMTMLQNPEYQKLVEDVKSGVPGAPGRLGQFMAEALPSHAATIGRAVDGAIEKTVKTLQTSPEGKRYSFMKGGEAVLEESREWVKKHGGLDAYHGSALKDAYTKDATNGQAVRGFMLRMIDQHTPYADQAQQALGMFNQQLGDIDAHRAHILMHIIDLYNQDLKKTYAQQIEMAATRMDSEYGAGKGDIIREQTAPGLDVAAWAGTKSAPAPRAGAVPHRPVPPEAELYLKKHPETKKQFDSWYGTGAADRILSGGPPLHRSALFHPVADGRAVIERLFPGIHVTDAHRDPGNPTGRPNDWHHKSNAAVDVRPASLPGWDFHQFLMHIENSGYKIIEARDEQTHPIPGITHGPHWHVVIGEDHG